MGALRRDGSPPFQGSLTPVTLVVYLALHAIWAQMVFGPYAFVILRLLFLFGVALVLLTHGRGGGEVRGYFIGRVLPAMGLARIVFTLVLFAAPRLVINAFHSYPLLIPGAWWGDCVIAPINEEMVFRGIFMAVLLQYLPGRPALAIGIGTLIFISIHDLTGHNLSSLLVLGTLLGWTYWKSRSVPFCILCHALWNACSFIPIVLYP